MKTLNKIKNGMFVAMVAVCGAFALQSCDDDDSVYAYDSQLHSFGPSPASRGESIRIIGEGLGGVSKVIFPVDVEVTDFISKSNDEIVVNVPQEAVPGRIRLIIGGKEITSKSIITFAEPISVESVTAQAEVLTAGDEIIVTGEYLYNIATVTFGNNAEVSSEDFTMQERHEMHVKVPAAAKTGKITFSDGADWTYTTENEFEIATASVASLSKTDLTEGETLTIYGENLQLVSRVLFPGDIEPDNFTIADDGKSIVTSVPVGTCSGVINLELFSLDRIATPEFTVPTIEVISVSPDRNVVPGMKLTVTGRLLNLVSRIQFPGGEEIVTGWSVNADGTELTVAVPESMVDGKISFVQNDNIVVVSDAVSTKKSGNIFWTGNVELGNWATNFEVGAEKDPDVYAAFTEAITVPGKLTINFKQDAASTWWQLQPRYRRDWDITFSGVRDNGNGGIVNTDEGQTSLTVNLSQEDVDELHGQGWAFSGCFLTITSMSFEDPNAAQVFLGLNYDISPAGQWENMQISAQSDADKGTTYYTAFTEAITGPGTLEIHYEMYETVPAEEEVQAEFRYLYDGWGTHFTNVQDVVTFQPGSSVLTIELSQDDVDALQGWGKYATVTNKKGVTRPCDPWEIGWAISGKYFILKSFAFKPAL